MAQRCKFYHECKSHAVTMIPYSKMPLCKKHFLKYIEDRVWKTIQQYELIQIDENEKILVALSGGKDSQTLLTILNRVLNKRVKMEALYIEVGISPSNYSHDSAEIARQLCDDLDIPFHILDTKKEYGFTIDEIHQMGQIMFRHGQRRKNNRFRGECSYCGLTKRYAINRFAAENGFTKVATGHNLTDEATQLLSNFFNVDMELMSRAGPTTITDVEGLIPRIKPLYFIYEKEMILYAYYAEVKFLSTQCEYATDSPMIRVKEGLEQIETFRRGNMMNMVRDFQRKLKPILFETIPEFKKIEKKCENCGMPTYLDNCSFCRNQEMLLKKIGIMKEILAKSDEKSD